MSVARCVHAFVACLVLLAGCQDDDTSDEGTDEGDGDALLCAGQIYIRSQYELAQIAACTEIDGSLQVEGQDWLTVLELPVLESVWEDLLIVDNDNLTGIELPNLTVVERSLFIQDNDKLAHIDGLDSLVNTGNLTEYLYVSFAIEGNDSLESVELPSLSRARAILEISQNPSLSRISMPELWAVEGNLRIEDNPLLTTLSMPSLTTAGPTSAYPHEYWNVYITGNSSLTSLEGLSALSSLGGDLIIKSNPSLTSLSGLADPLSLYGYMEITDNDGLLTLEGLPTLRGLEGLDIEGNAGLVDLAGLSELPEYTYVAVGYSTSLVSLTGLPEGFDSGLSVYGNPLLTSLDGLPIQGAESENRSIPDLSLSSNHALTDISVLTGVSTVEGSLAILSNDALSDLSPLSDLTSIEGYLIIMDNDCMDPVALEELVSSLAVGGGTTVKDNGASYPCE